MPEKPITWDDFSLGLWLAGAKELVPNGALRRARGVARGTGRSLRSRWGSTTLHALSNAHSLHRFADSRFAGVGTELYRDGVSIKSGLSGDRLAFVRMPPQPAKADYLFCAGGGDLFKVDSAGAVTQWGITAPLTDFTVAVGVAGALTGTYKYHVTFKNTTSGSRSNSNTNEQSVTLSSEKADLSSIPVSSDSQVDARELWRTVADGTVLFLLTTIADNTTTIHTDNTIDANLGTESLPTDNLPPEDVYDDAVGPHASRMWWTRDSSTGKGGRVYYSPIGRPESVVGFLDVTSVDDQTQKAIPWGGSLWAFTKSRIVQVFGATEPFGFRDAFGAQGTILPFTAAPTDAGIFYRGTDGVHLFDGRASRHIGPALDDIFVGNTVEGLGPFTGVVGAIGREEYYISDGSDTLALQISNFRWRDLGIAASSLFFEEDTKKLVAGLASEVRSVEDEGVSTEAGGSLAFEVETSSRVADPQTNRLIKRLNIKANTNGQIVTPVLVLDGGTITLPVFQTTSNVITTFGIGRYGRILGVRLTANLSAQIEVDWIRATVNIPAEVPVG